MVPRRRQKRVQRVGAQGVQGVRTLKSASSSKRLGLGLGLFVPVRHVLSSAHLLVIQSLCPSPGLLRMYCIPCVCGFNDAVPPLLSHILALVCFNSFLCCV